MINMKLAVSVLPVSDVDRAKRFYESLGFRDHRGGARPVQGLHLVVQDIEAARAEFVHRGVDVSDVFHDAGGIFHHAGNKARVAGPDPKRRSYGSFASFQNPDGNGWVLQEVKERAPGR